MVKCTCIEKFRDKQGRIKGYRLQDVQGKCIDVTPDNLKMAVFSKQFNVVNLQLTSDGRLIDKEVSVQESKPQPDEAEVKKKAFNSLLKLINYYYDPNETRADEKIETEDGSCIEPWLNKNQKQAVKSFRTLGVDIKELPKLEINNAYYSYCVGKTALGFARFTGIDLGGDYYDETLLGIVKTREIQNGKTVFTANKLKQLIAYLKSNENMDCVQFYDVYIHIINELSKVLNKYHLANKLVLKSENNDTDIFISLSPLSDIYKKLEYSISFWYYNKTIYVYVFDYADILYDSKKIEDKSENKEEVLKYISKVADEIGKRIVKTEA